jgi:3-deoxy-D-manno-octulosonic-acid transferase
MRWLYNIGISLYYGMIVLASPVNLKARKWLRGRRDQVGRLQQLAGREKVVWMHCASLGEFEQGRPFLESFRRQYPEFRVLLTFFSSSGYDVRKNYQGADDVFYLPHDSVNNARRFVRLVNPAMVFFVKYEYWYNYIDILHREGIPVFLLSAIFRHGQVFFRWYGRWFRRQLDKITFFFVQNQSSLNLLKNMGISNAMITGDTRFDRVWQITHEPVSFPLVEAFIQQHHILVAGSTWPADEEKLLPLMNENNEGLKFVIVPHEVTEKGMATLMDKIKVNAVRYSKATMEEAQKASVMIIDTVGMLAHVYRYATLAYIGGGFGRGIHNILEAVVYGIPVIFGPRYHKFREATDLIASNGAFAIEHSRQLYSKVFELLDDDAFLASCAVQNRIYVENNKGATTLILTKISDYINPTRLSHDTENK